MEQIERDLRQFVIENFLYGDTGKHFANDDSFLEKGLIDSMSIVTLVAHIQQRYAVHLTNEELTPENLDSVCRLAGFVQGKIGKAK